MIFNIHYDIGAILICLFSMFCILLKKGIHKRQNRILLCILVFILLSAILDVWSSVANSYLIYSPSVKKILSYSFLFVHNFLPFFFTSYIVVVFGTYRQKKSIYWLWFFLPLCCSLLFLTLNPVFQWIFYYDSEGTYRHGTMVYGLYFSAFIYVLIAFDCIIRHKEAVILSKRIAMCFFLGTTIMATVIQMMFPQLLIELFFEALAFLGILVTIENEDEIFNGITGVFNRKAFICDSETFLANRTLYEMLTLKLPDLNYYNSALGIKFMNQVLYDIAGWLTEIDRKINVYDCENGHFCLIYFDESKREEIINAVHRRFEEAWSVDDIDIQFTVQICVASIPADTDTLEKLLLIVDTPFTKREKESEIISVERFGCYKRELQVEHAVEKAIQKRSFQVYYQPIWDCATGRIHSAEALLRLFDEELGMVPPDEFIPLAEKNGTILQIGEFVFEEVCRFYSEHQLDTIGIDYIEVNLSVVQCMNKRLTATFVEILKRYGLDSSRINLEVTESAVANSMEALESTLKDLRAAGFSFSMDDYGTGYSNFSYMLDMPFEIVKLDKSILWSADKNPKAEIILRNTLNMIKEMELKAVVEGVETEEQKELLLGLQCDYCQGYYFSKPVNRTLFLQFCQTYGSVG